LFNRPASTYGKCKKRRKPIKDVLSRSYPIKSIWSQKVIICLMGLPLFMEIVRTGNNPINDLLSVRSLSYKINVVLNGKCKNRGQSYLRC
jgi:hypothetical protein